MIRPRRTQLRKSFADLKQVMTGLDGATKGSEARKLFDEIKLLTEKYAEGYAKASHDAHEIESLLNGDMREDRRTDRGRRR